MNLKELLESKIREFDASIDLADGSRIQRTVIAPILNALSTDPLSVNTRDYLYARFSEVFPDAPITRGNALDDILITAAEYFISGYREELSRLKNATSIENLDLLSDDEADALASNWFVSRDGGASATGSVTITVDRTSAISINIGSVRFFGGDQEYAPTTNTVVTTDALLSGALGGGLYRFTINIRSISVGTAGNVVSGRITRASGIPNVVSVTNESPIVGGVSRDSTEYLLTNKLPRAISERSLVTARGIGARIATDIPGVLRYQVIGHGDVEMLRDRVEVQSYSDLVANGHAYYMSNFAFIAGYRYLSDVLATNDELCVLGPLGSPAKYKIMRVLNSSDVNVLNNSDLGFTKLVELDTIVSDQVSGHVSVLRPNTALLDDVLVDGTIGLGGRVDVHMRGDDQQSVIGSAVLELENSYRGRGWVSLNNTVTITLDAPLSGNEFSRYDHLIIGDTAYTISSIDYVAGELEAVIYLFDENLPPSNGSDYHIVTDLVYNTSTNTRIVSPSRGGVGRLSAIIGSTEVSILDVDLINDGVRQGDIIEIPELDIRRSIFSVSSQTVAFTDNPFQQTFSDVGARVIRSVASAVNPITEIDVPSVMPRHPIGVDVKTIREEIGTVTSGIGNVLLPLGDRILRETGGNAMGVAVGTIFANVLNRDSTFYRIPTNNESGNQISRLTPTAYGYNRDILGRCSVLVGEPVPLINDASENGINEINTWTDLFTDNANNIFVLRGDALTSGSFLDHPGKDVQSGDILRIRSGYLSGDYVIESIIHNTLVKSGSKALTSNTADAGTILHEGDYTYKDITDEDNLENSVIFQNITLVRIYGQFPNNPLRAISKHLNLTVTPLFVGVGGEQVGSLDSGFLNAYLNGNADMFKAEMSSEILGEFRTSVQTSLLSGNTQDVPKDLRSLFSDVLNTSYEIIRPAEGIGEVRTRREGDQVLLSKPSVQHIDINDLIVDLKLGRARSVNHRDYSDFIGSAGTYHISPLREYYVDGSDYREWNSALRAILHDNRIMPNTYADRYQSDFFIFDELLEVTSSGIMPMTVSGMSSIDFPFLRNSGSRLTRHAEVDVINASLSLVAESSVSLESFIFAAPFFPEEQTRENIFDTPKAWVLGQDDAINIYGDVPALNYIHKSHPAYNELIASLGNAVDGTGTLLSEVYSQYEAFFELKATHTSSQDVLEYLVSLYGQVIEARFWIPGSSDLFVTDEFLAGSLLYRSGNVYELPQQASRPISVATVSERSDKLEVIPSTTLSALSNTLEGLKARVEYRDSVYWRNVAYTAGNDVYLDEPLPFGTPTALAYGICIYDSEINKVRLISDPIFSGGQSALDSWDEEFTTHLNTGGASRQITSTDVGNHITLWGYRTNDADYLSVLLNSPIPEYETEEEFLSSILGPERETFGQFEITEVVPTFVDVVGGAEAVPSKIDISISGSVDPVSPRISDTEATLIACAFVITSPTLAIEDELINSVARVTMYRSDPYKYNFVGVSKTISDRYIVQGRSGTLNYDYVQLRDELKSEVEVSTFVLQNDNSLEPTTIETNHLIQITDQEDLVIRTTNARAAIKDQTISVDGTHGLGYDLSPTDLSLSMSTQDNVAIRVPCTPGSVEQTLAVSGYFDTTTGLAQSLVDLTSERPVCANILVKSLCTAYIGLEVLYVGGPTEAELTSELESFIRSRIISDGSITRSMITSIVMNMGATTVHEPIDLYVCVEDRSRRIHKRTIVDSLEEATLFNMDTTLRILYPSIAVDNRLGARISVQRFSSLSNLIGNGGS